MSELKSPAAAPPKDVERLWRASQFIPQSVRLLGTRYRPLFLAHARHVEPAGENTAVADALAFIDFMFTQERIALLDPERKALRNDARQLKRKYKLVREGTAISARERWKILQWLSL